MKTKYYIKIYKLIILNFILEVMYYELN